MTKHMREGGGYSRYREFSRALARDCAGNMCQIGAQRWLQRRGCVLMDLRIGADPQHLLGTLPMTGTCTQLERDLDPSASGEQWVANKMRL